MSEDSCIAAGCTRPDPDAVTVARVGERFSVCYAFDTSATRADLLLPYAVAVNGTILPEFDRRAARLDRNKRRICVAARQGDKVALYLNSDAWPQFRRHPVYAVTVGKRDILVEVVEKPGRDGAALAALKDPYPKPSRPGGGTLDAYQARLTGDVWLHVSHQYTEAEAKRCLPAGIDAGIADAVLGIYRGLSAPRMTVAFPASDSAAALTIEFEPGSDDNARANITSFNLLRDGVARVHPHAYVALLTGARAAGVTRLGISSGWRPMIGSIEHRIGLALDTNYIDNPERHVAINRVALTQPGGAGKENVSEKERALYQAYLLANAESGRRKGEAIAAEKIAQHNPSSENIAQRDASNRRSDAASESMKKAEHDWNDERNKIEPSLIKNLRGVLHKDRAVHQLLDPWYIDLNTNNPASAIPNLQRNALEKLHANHLHITITEPNP
jgi:hypothetical protein